MKFKSKCGNHTIIVDDEDYNKVMEFATNGYEARLFTNSNNRYAVTRKTINGQRKQFFVHRLIMNVLHDSKIHIDHINRNPLDNRKSNLRIVTRRENMKNRTSSKNSYSKHLGVSYCNSKRGSNKYRVGIKDFLLHKNNIFLGYYSDEDSAAYAYNIAAKIIHKEFANLNDVSKIEIIEADDIEKYVIEKIKLINKDIVI
jgi:hypothetical protein